MAWQRHCGDVCPRCSQHCLWTMLQGACIHFQGMVSGNLSVHCSITYSVQESKFFWSRWHWSTLAPPSSVAYPTTAYCAKAVLATRARTTRGRRPSCCQYCFGGDNWWRWIYEIRPLFFIDEATQLPCAINCLLLCLVLAYLVRVLNQSNLFCKCTQVFKLLAHMVLSSFSFSQDKS